MEHLGNNKKFRYIFIVFMVFVLMVVGNEITQYFLRSKLDKQKNTRRIFERMEHSQRMKPNFDHGYNYAPVS